MLARAFDQFAKCSCYFPCCLSPLLLVSKHIAEFSRSLLACPSTRGKAEPVLRLGNTWMTAPACNPACMKVREVGDRKGGEGGHGVFKMQAA